MSEIYPELLIHANKDLNNATLVADRHIQLGGIPVGDLQDLGKMGKSDNVALQDHYVEVILEQNIIGKRYAKCRYRGLANHTIEVDNTTSRMVVPILNEELEREQYI